MQCGVNPEHCAWCTERHCYGVTSCTPDTCIIHSPIVKSPTKNGPGRTTATGKSNPPSGGNPPSRKPRPVKPVNPVSVSNPNKTTSAPVILLRKDDSGGGRGH